MKKFRYCLLCIACWLPVIGIPVGIVWQRQRYPKCLHKANQGILLLYSTVMGVWLWITMLVVACLMRRFL